MNNYNHLLHTADQVHTTSLIEHTQTHSMRVRQFVALFVFFKIVCYTKRSFTAFPTAPTQIPNDGVYIMINIRLEWLFFTVAHLDMSFEVRISYV